MKKKKKEMEMNNTEKHKGKTEIKKERKTYDDRKQKQEKGGTERNLNERPGSVRERNKTRARSLGMMKGTKQTNKQTQTKGGTKRKLMKDQKLLEKVMKQKVERKE